MKPKFSKEQNYQTLLQQISETFTNHKNKAIKLVNTEIVNAYWYIGRYIVEFEQAGNIKAEYGKYLLIQLSKDLKVRLGKGFSRTNLIYMRLLYLTFPKSQTLSDQLSWSHYIELLGISDELERNFYEQQTILEKWSVRELKRQKKTALFQRLALSKDKKTILALSKKGNLIKSVDDIQKDPYVFEFLGLPENNLFSEAELEERLLNKLQQFLLELGKGFAFVGRQYRITLNNRHYRVDLVFYHYILKCFVLIDLKVDKIHHHDIGQMNLYINYFKTEERQENDNEPIGIILTKEKDDILVEYATGGITNQLFVSKYQSYLPDKEVLKQEVQKILTENND